jgi:hypothetical protein
VSDLRLVAKLLVRADKCPVFPCPVRDKSTLHQACVECWLKFLKERHTKEDS